MAEKKGEGRATHTACAAAELEAQQAELDLAQLKLDNGIAPERPAESMDADMNDCDEEAVSALTASLDRWRVSAIALSFPGLSSPRARQLTGDMSSGVTLDFVIDTAANTTISGRIAGPTSKGGLELTQVGQIVVAWAPAAHRWSDL